MFQNQFDTNLGDEKHNRNQDSAKHTRSPDSIGHSDDQASTQSLNKLGDGETRQDVPY